MSRHRHKTEVELGEPLPLPYQIKEEEREEEAPQLDYEPIRKRRWRDVSDHDDTTQNTTKTAIPKLLGYLSKHRNTSAGERSPIDTIRHHVQEIRTTISTHNLQLPVQVLDDFEALLDQDTDIMAELKKLQQSRANSSNYLAMASAVLILVVAMAVSFLASGLNYDYCYYFC